MRRANGLLVSLVLLGAGCGNLDAAKMPSTDAGAAPSYASRDAGAMSSPPSTGTSPSPGIQAGTLTAGSFDDHYFSEVFDEFVAKMELLTAAAHVKERALIRVVNVDGKPITDARITVKQQGVELVSLLTGSSGEALYFPGLDGGKSGELELSAEKDGISATRTVQLAEAPWRITLDVAAPLPTKADIAFLVDVTGSMGDELEFLKVETESIVQQVQARYSSLELRFALVVYRDQGDAFVTKTFDFADLAAFKQNLAAQSADGGGDTPEALDAAFAKAGQLSWATDGRARMLFHVADAPPHDQAIGTVLGLFDTFRHKGVRVYPVAASGVDDRAEYVMRVAAFKTMARYIFLTDDSGYGGDHADPSIPPNTPTKTQQVTCYHIEKLNSLIVRMISSELAGVALPPAASEILKTVGTPVDGVCDPAERNR
jgi:hypothetical protein